MFYFAALDGGASSVGARAVAKKSTTRSDSTPPQPLLTRTLYERRAIQSDRDKRDGRVVVSLSVLLVPHIHFVALPLSVVNMCT